jgi:hypothetical protein
MTRAAWRGTGVALLACAAAWAAVSARAHDSGIARRADIGQVQMRAPAPNAIGVARAESGALAGTATPRQHVLSDGTVIAETTDDVMSTMVVVRGKDGKLVHHVVSGETIANSLALGNHAELTRQIRERVDAVK